MAHTILKQFFAILVFLFSHGVMWGQSTYKVNTQKLNVRSAPSTNAAIVGSLKQGEVVNVENISGGWATITYGGRICYVSASFLKQEDSMTPQASSKNSRPNLTQTGNSASHNSPPLSSSKYYTQRNSYKDPALWNFSVGAMSHTSYGEHLFDWSLMLGGDIPIRLGGNPFTLETGLRYLNQKTSIFGDYLYTEYDEDYYEYYEGNSSILEVPLRLAYDLRLAKDFSLRFSAGPYLSWLLSEPGGINIGIEPSVALKYKYVSLGLQYTAPVSQGFKNEYSHVPMLTLGIRFKSSAWKYIGEGLTVVGAGLGAYAATMSAGTAQQNTMAPNNYPSVINSNGNSGGNTDAEHGNSRDDRYVQCSQCNGTGRVFSPSGTKRSEHEMYHYPLVTVNNCSICKGSHCAKCNTTSAHKKCPKCQGRGETRR